MQAFGGLHGIEDLLVAGVKLAHADIVADGAIEEENVLADKTDLRAQAGDFGFAEVDAVEKYRALGRVIEPQDQLQESGFAAAAGSHDDDKLAAWDFEREVAEDLARGVWRFV